MKNPFLKSLISSRFFNAFSIFLFFLLVATAVYATTPSPGHPWTQVGDGTFQVTGPLSLRTYAFPNSDATVVTSSSFSQGDILYGSAASTTAQLAKDSNSTRYVSNTGSSNNPAWAQVDMTNGVTGILPAANGGTANGFTAFTGPSASTKTFTLPNASATILTTNAVLTVAQGGTNSATLSSGGILLGNGASALATILPKSDGEVIVTGVTSSSTDPVLFTTFGLYPGVLNGVTALSSGITYFQFMGVAPKDYTSCTIVANVVTGAGTITWAEVGVFTGAPPLNTTASLTRLGFTDVSSTFNLTGVKTTAVTVTVKTGDPLWVAYGSQAGTPFQLRALLADSLQSGVFQVVASRLSTASTPVTTILNTISAAPSWLGMKCT